MARAAKNGDGGSTARAKGPTMTVRRNCFIAILRDTGNVSRAAREAGLATSGLYEHRKRNPTFAAQWEGAVAESLDDLEQAMIERARIGVEKPVYFRGEQVGAVRSYSDALGMFMLKARRPEIYARLIDAAPARAIEEMSDAEARAEVDRRLDRLVDPSAGEDGGEHG